MTDRLTDAFDQVKMTERHAKKCKAMKAEKRQRTVSLEVEVYEQVEALAKEQRRSFASQVNWLIAEQLKQMARAA